MAVDVPTSTDYWLMIRGIKLLLLVAVTRNIHFENGNLLGKNINTVIRNI
jgi:hypothetical protein